MARSRDVVGRGESKKWTGADKFAEVIFVTIIEGKFISIIKFQRNTLKQMRISVAGVKTWNSFNNGERGAVQIFFSLEKCISYELYKIQSLDWNK